MSRIVYRISNIKVIFKILNSLKKSSVAKINKKYLNSFKADKQPVLYDFQNPIFPKYDLLNKFIYKNEEWEVVKNRFHDRFLKFFNLPIMSIDNNCSDNKIKIVGDNLYFNSRGLKDDWIYLYLSDTSLKNYILMFDVVLNSKFRELQFGFRYVDFYNRYRFRIEKNYLHFDIIEKGQFYNSLFSEPILLNLDESYNFLIVVKDDKFSFLCNGNVLMTITDNSNLFSNGAVALILWDDCGDSNIQGVFKNVNLSSIN